MQMVDLIPELHWPFAQFIQMEPWAGGPENSLRKLAWMSRGHFKSSITTIGNSLRKLCIDRNTTIGIVSAKQENTQQWLLDVRNCIDFNPFFRWAFTEIRSGGKWSETSITVTRDKEFGTNVASSIRAYTINGGLASAHHPNIILDDPLNEQTAFSESERERAIGLYVHLESIIAKYSESVFTVVGTPWPGYDVIQHAMEHECQQGDRLYWGIGARGGFQMSPELYDTHPELIPDIEHRLRHDRVIFHEVCPDKKLAKIKRQDLNQYIYQYLCTRPDDEDNGFDIKLIRDFALFLDGRISCDCHPGHAHHLNSLQTVAICDPALTEDRRGCESAICVVGRDPRCGCRFQLYENGWRVLPDALVDIMCDVAREWPTIKIFAIEDVQFQATFKPWLIERQSTGKFPLGVRIEGVKPQKRDKDLRIAGQQAYVANGLWHKRPDMYFDESRINWIWEVAKWPNQPKKRDRADVWAYSDDVWEMCGLSTELKANPLLHPAVTRNKISAQKALSAMKKALGN